MLAPEVFITCAVTGSADSVRKNPNVPVTPAQIAASALEAHAAGESTVGGALSRGAATGTSAQAHNYKDKQICRTIVTSPDGLLPQPTGPERKVRPRDSDTYAAQSRPSA